MVEGATVDRMVQEVGVPASEVRHHVRNLAGKGVGHVVEGGVVRAVLGKGRTAESFLLPEE